MPELRMPSNRLVLGESRAVLEPALLAMNSFKLATQPRGNGRAVLVLPGLAASDRSTFPLRSYLRGLNYDARGWGLGQNDGNVRRFARQIAGKVEQLAESTGRPIPLIGWSLGGVISREVARHVPHAVEQVITFGSPVFGRAPARSVPLTAIYTKGDGIVAWRSCVDDGDPNVEHVEVRSTHLGMGIHHAVYVQVAQRLHRARAHRETSSPLGMSHD